MPIFVPRSIHEAARTQFEAELGSNWAAHVQRLNREQIKTQARAASSQTARAMSKADALRQTLEHTTAKLLDAQSLIELHNRGGALGLGLSHRQAPALAPAGAPPSQQALVAPHHHGVLGRARPQSARQPSAADAKREARVRYQVACARFHAKLSPRTPDPPSNARSCVAPPTMWDGPRRAPPPNTGYGANCWYKPAPPRPPPAPPQPGSGAGGVPAEAVMSLADEHHQPQPPQGQAQAALRRPASRPAWATESWIARQRERPSWQTQREERERRLRQRLLSEAEAEAEAAAAAAAGGGGGGVGGIGALPAADEERPLSAEEVAAAVAVLSPAEAALDEEILQLHAFLKTKIEGRFAQLRRAFRLIDLDKSGSCDRAELKAMLQNMFNLHVADAPMERLIDLIDFDGSGDIVLSEFNRFFTTTEPLNLRQRMVQLRRQKARQQQQQQPGHAQHRGPLRRPASAR